MTKVGHTSCSIFTFCHVANAVAWASCSARDHSLKSQHLAVHSLAVISAAGGVGNAKEMSAPSRGDQPRPSAQLVLSTGWFELQQLLYRHVQPSNVHLGKRFNRLQQLQRVVLGQEAPDSRAFLSLQKIEGGLPLHPSSPPASEVHSPPVPCRRPSFGGPESQHRTGWQPRTAATCESLRAGS